MRSLCSVCLCCCSRAPAKVDMCRTARHTLSLCAVPRSGFSPAGCLPQSIASLVHRFFAGSDCATSADDRYATYTARPWQLWLVTYTSYVWKPAADICCDTCVWSIVGSLRTLGSIEHDVQIHFKDHEGDRIRFAVKPSAPLQEALVLWHQQTGVPMHAARMLCNGEALQGNCTPEQVCLREGWSMADGFTIDMLLSQGGC
jgi:hypothetical protein